MEKTQPTTNTTGRQSPGTTPETSEIPCDRQEGLPLPKGGFDSFDILYRNLSRAVGIISLIVDNPDLETPITDAASAARGIIKHSQLIVDHLFKVVGEKALREQEVQS